MNRLPFCRSFRPATLTNTAHVIALGMTVVGASLNPVTRLSADVVSARSSTKASAGAGLAPPTRYEVFAIGDRKSGAPTDVNNHGEILFSSGSILQLKGGGRMIPSAAGVAPVGVGPMRLSRIAAAINDQGDVLFSDSSGVFLVTEDGERACIVSRVKNEAYTTNGGRLPVPSWVTDIERWQSVNNKRRVLARASIPTSSDGRTSTSVLHVFDWEAGRLEQISGRYGEWEETARGKKFSTRCIVMDSNDAGSLAGHLDTVPVGPKTFAFFLDSEGSIHRLPPLQGASKSFGFGLNNRDQVVGYSLARREVATLWHEGQPIDLNARIAPESGWQLRRGHRINDEGVIIGEGTWNGKPQNFVLVPIREDQNTGSHDGSTSPVR